MLIFYCNICGKQAGEFKALSHEDCPEQKAVKAGHSIVTMCVSKIQREKK